MPARRFFGAGCMHCPGLPHQLWRAPCGSGLGRDAAMARRRLRFRPQSRASSLPQTLALTADSECSCGSGLGRDTVVAVRRPRCGLLSGSEDPSHRGLSPAPLVDQARSLWERPRPRQGLCSPQVSLQVAVGVRRPLPQGLTLTPLVDQARSWWERPWPRQGLCRLQASLQAAVGVKTPPTEPPCPGSSSRSGAFLVGAALAATGRRR